MRGQPERLTVTEDMHKIGMIFEAFFDAEDTRLDELSLQRVLCDGSLNDVCTIEAVHAVGSNDTGLSMVWFRGYGRVWVDDDVEVPARKWLSS